jgi:hypothetical protein
MFPPVLEIPSVKIRANHRGSISFRTVISPLTVIVVLATRPVQFTLPVFLSILEVSFIDITVVISHGALTVVFTIFELANVFAVTFFSIFSLPIELVKLPIAMIGIAIYVLYSTVAVLLVSLPRTLVCVVARTSFSALSFTVSGFEVALIFGFHNY